MGKNVQRIKKSDKEKLNYKGIEFSVSKGDYYKVDTKNNSNTNMFVYKKKQVRLIYLSKKNFKNHIEFLLIENEGSSHYVHIKCFKTKH